LKKSIFRSRVFLSFEYHIFSFVSLFEKKMKVWPVLLVHINKERKIIIEWLSYVTYFLRNRMKERILEICTHFCGLFLSLSPDINTRENSRIFTFALLSIRLNTISLILFSKCISNSWHWFSSVLLY
jgi:hypothetical protein